MSEAPDSGGKTTTTTMGEELWRVHVNRHSSSGQPDTDDLDHEAESAFYHKPPSDRSIGEELWLVHCQRSRGLTPDDEDEQEEKGEKKRVVAKKPKVKEQDPQEGGGAAKIIHLRNRDVKVAP